MKIRYKPTVENDLMQIVDGREVGVLGIRVGPDTADLFARAPEMEEELADLKAENMKLRHRVSDLKFALGTDSVGWFDRAMRAERERDEARVKLVEHSERHDHPSGLVHKDAYAEVVTERDELMAERNQLRQDLEAEQQGRMVLRAQYGARDDETFGQFVKRIAEERKDAK